MAIISRHFDKDRADDALTSIISVAYVASGIVQWRRTNSGASKPVGFYDGAVLVLSGGQSMWFFELATGKILAEFNRKAGPQRGGRWNDFAIVKQGPMLVVGGEDDERKGNVEILDPGESP